MGAVQIEVTVYDDGGTSVRVPPIDGDRMSAVLRSAATALARHAESADAERAPLECPICGVEPVGIVAELDGRSFLRPCGHAMGEASRG